MAGGPQPYAGSTKNLTLSPAANTLGLADLIVQQVQDHVADAKKKSDEDDQADAFTGSSLSPAVMSLFGKQADNGA
jgi:hypothetical protein